MPANEGVNPRSEVSVTPDKNSGRRGLTGAQPEGKRDAMDDPSGATDGEDSILIPKECAHASVLATTPRHRGCAPQEPDQPLPARRGAAGGPCRPNGGFF